MSLADDLLQHAFALWADSNHVPGSDIRLRRAVAAAYYALFHKIIGDAVAQLAPDVPPAINHRMQRWFDHSEIKRICGRFAKAQLEQPLLGLIGSSASAELRMVADFFITLQEARHSADYDLNYSLSERECRLFLEASRRAIEAWNRLAGSAERNIFILSLLLWKNWEKDRP